MGTLASVLFVLAIIVAGIGGLWYGTNVTSSQTCTALTGVQNTPESGQQVIVQCGTQIFSTGAGSVACGISRGDKVTVGFTNWFGSHITGDLSC